MQVGKTILIFERKFLTFSQYNVKPVVVMLKDDYDIRDKDVLRPSPPR